MTPNKFYYISSGALNAMRTLRAVIHVPGVYFRDEYICNLARDWGEAVSKARARIGSEAHLEGSEFDLNKWGAGASKIKPWMKQQLEQIYTPFGKHKGSKLVDLPESYVKYWVEQSASNAVGQRLVQKFTDIANERDYFAKWDKAEAEKEAARLAELAKMEYVGDVGDRMVVFLRCDKVLSFSGGTTWATYTTYLNICRDRHGNEFVYKGSKAWDEGKYYKATVTIKEHKEYQGKKQNIIKIIEKETENV